jgi:hypothetical protein
MERGFLSPQVFNELCDPFIGLPVGNSGHQGSIVIDLFGHFSHMGISAFLGRTSPSQAFRLRDMIPNKLGHFCGVGSRHEMACRGGRDHGLTPPSTTIKIAGLQRTQIVRNIAELPD